MGSIARTSCRHTASGASAWIWRIAFHHLAAGRYQIGVRRGSYQPGEEAGAAAVDTLAGQTQRVEVALARTGTGQPLLGTLVFDMAELGVGPGGADIEIQAVCGPPPQYVRSRVVRSSGPFQLDDIPPGPCLVDFTVQRGERRRWLCAKPDEPDVDGRYVRSLAFCPPERYPCVVPSQTTVVDPADLEAVRPSPVTR